MTARWVAKAEKAGWTVRLEPTVSLHRHVDGPAVRRATAIVGVTLMLQEAGATAVSVVAGPHHPGAWPEGPPADGYVSVTASFAAELEGPVPETARSERPFG